MTMHPFLPSLLVLATLAAALAGHGVAAVWIRQTGATDYVAIAYIVAAAAQAACVTALTTRRTAVGVTTWLTILTLCQRGLLAAGFSDGAWVAATMLQSLVWLLARGLQPAEPWTVRMERWGRTQVAISGHLAAAEGAVPGVRWLRRLLPREPAGAAQRAASPSPTIAAADIERALAAALGAWDAGGTRAAATAVKESGHAA